MKRKLSFMMIYSNISELFCSQRARDDNRNQVIDVLSIVNINDNLSIDTHVGGRNGLKSVVDDPISQNWHEWTAI